jgi:hypothetical protein
MPYCKSGKHFWISETDAKKCCNGYKRTVCIPADASCDTVNADNVGYKWIKEGDTLERKSEKVVNVRRFVKNIGKL